MPRSITPLEMAYLKEWVLATYYKLWDRNTNKLYYSGMQTIIINLCLHILYVSFTGWLQPLPIVDWVRSSVYAWPLWHCDCATLVSLPETLSHELQLLYVQGALLQWVKSSGTDIRSGWVQGSCLLWRCAVGTDDVSSKVQCSTMQIPISWIFDIFIASCCALSRSIDNRNIN